MPSSMRQVAVAFDWFPNTNYTGFYVARQKGWYHQLGLEVSFLSPHMDNYKTTPAARLTQKTAHFACVPSESIISFHTWPDGAKPKIQAIATLLQNSTSAVVTLQSSGIDRPAKLDGKVYASYGARYEGRIVQQLIRNDGGKGDYSEVTPDMLGIWNTVLNGASDATWVFLGWEGIQARRAGVDLNVFRLEDFGVAYGYSPILAAHPDTLHEDPEMVRAFLAATARGFQFAAEHPNAAADILMQEVAVDCAEAPLPMPWDPDMVHESQIFVSGHYVAPSGAWGVMDMSQWEAFLNWLHDNKLLTSKAQSRTCDASSEKYTSLDGLRAGDVGELLPRGAIDITKLATNAYLPVQQ